jgi:hypothetical protein
MEFMFTRLPVVPAFYLACTGRQEKYRDACNHRQRGFLRHADIPGLESGTGTIDVLVTLQEAELPGNGPGPAVTGIWLRDISIFSAGKYEIDLRYFSFLKHCSRYIILISFNMASALPNGTDNPVSGVFPVMLIIPSRSA